MVRGGSPHKTQTAEGQKATKAPQEGRGGWSGGG